MTALYDPAADAAWTTNDTATRAAAIFATVRGDVDTDHRFIAQMMTPKVFRFLTCEQRVEFLAWSCVYPRSKALRDLVDRHHGRALKPGPGL